MIKFEVPGIPNAQPRQRHRLRRTKAGKTFVQNYTSERDPVIPYKSCVRLCCKEAMKGTPMIEGPIKVELLFVMPRPKGLIWKNKPMRRLEHIKTPDLDNLEKAVLDSLKQVAWRDDSQVCRVVKEKIVAAGNESARTIVWIEPYQLGGDAEAETPKCVTMDPTTLGHGANETETQGFG